MSNNKYCRYLYIALAVLLVSVLALNGCNLFYGKNITVDEGIAHFYFECPDRYKVKSIDARDEPDLKFTYVTIAGPYGGSISPYIYIDINYPFEGRENAQAAWEYQLRFYEVYDNFEIVSSSTTTIDGIQANEYIVAFTHTPDPDRDPDLKPVDMMAKDIYFDYNGLIWNLNVRSSALYFTSNEARFGQLIESFKILE
jgi:hypothetical protein